MGTFQEYFFQPSDEPPFAARCELIAEAVADVKVLTMKAVLYRTFEDEFIVTYTWHSPEGVEMCLVDTFDDLDEAYENLVQEDEQEGEATDPRTDRARRKAKRALLAEAFKSMPDELGKAKSRWRLERCRKNPEGPEFMSAMLSCLAKLSKPIVGRTDEVSKARANLLETMARLVRCVHEGYSREALKPYKQAFEEVACQYEALKVKLNMLACGKCDEWYPLPGPDPDRFVCPKCFASRPGDPPEDAR